jgi:16S rRNA (cytosine967-C5)-methyltransferase
VRRVFEQGAYADRALAGEAEGLSERDRALATRIAYGTVQRRATLDYVAARLVRRPLSTLEPATLAGLRVGLFQLLYLDRVATHAAVDETVELVKRSSPGGAGLVNAVLRRAARERSSLLDGLADGDPLGAAAMHSVPQWLAALWWNELGSEDARALMRRINDPAEPAVRVNTLVSGASEVARELGVESAPASGLPEGLVLKGRFDAHGSELWRRGAIMPQSRASILVSRLLEPEPGSRVLDLCAAPGAKTTHLAALIEDRGLVHAVERHSGRAHALEQTCARMRASCVQVEVGDAAHQRQDRFDRVLVDPPCSGLGTLQSRPDRRWRASPDGIRELSSLQRQILEAGADATRPGGLLVYSVCTISLREGEEVVGGFLREHPEFEADDLLAEHPSWGHPRGIGRHIQLLPHRDNTDGFFVARLRRGR